MVRRLPLMPFATLLLTLVVAAGCSNLSQREQRMLTGGAIGAAGGALLVAVTGGSVLAGTLIGAGAGTAIGGLTTIGE